MPGYFVFLHQFIAHLGLVVLLISFDLKYLLISLLMYGLQYCFGGTIAYHRLLSHRSFIPKTWFYYLGSFLGVLSSSGSPLAWVAIHRKHHRFTDLEQDPHSMRFISWYKIQWLTMLIKPELKYASHLLRSKYQIFLHRYYFLIHFTYAGLLASIDPRMVIYLYLAPAALVWEAGSIINTVCHKWGYTNYTVANDSKNNTLVAWFTFGEGLHNNHHARQGNFSFRRRSGEIDLAGLVIPFLQKKDFKQNESKTF